jgi:hypothetical protein
LSSRQTRKRNHGEITDNLDTSIIGNTPSTTPHHAASLWSHYLAPEGTALEGFGIGADDFCIFIHWKAPSSRSSPKFLWSRESPSSAY